MAKRVRSLGSFLWETDEPVSTEDYLAARPSMTMCGCSVKVKLLEEEIETLRSTVRDLHLRLKVSALPTIPERNVTVTKPHLSMKQRSDPWYWLQMVPVQTADLPRMKQEIIPDIVRTSFADNNVLFDVCDVLIPSTILDHCEISIRSLYSKYPTIFKVGITRNPITRWLQGYSQDSRQKWSHLKVLAILPDPVSIGFVEAALIHRFQGTPGNMNVRRGGEGVDLSGAGPYFAYVAYRCLVPPRKT